MGAVCLPNNGAISTVACYNYMLHREATYMEEQCGTLSIRPGGGAGAKCGPIYNA